MKIVDFPGLNPGEWLNYYVLGTTFTSLPTGTGLAYALNTIKIDSETDYLFLRTNHWMTQNHLVDVYLKYQDDTSGRQLGKSAGLLRAISSQSETLDSLAYDFRSMQWREPFRIPAATTFTVQAANAHGVISPNLYLSFHGGKVFKGIAPHKIPGVQKIPYYYTLPNSSSTLPEGIIQIGANASYQTSIPIGNDGSFLCQAISGFSTGECTIMITEGARDSNWFNQPVHFRTIVGSGGVPNVLPVPRLTRKTTSIGITLLDLSGATNQIQLTFMGKKLLGI
jgi:hypothetical protein